MYFSRLKTKFQKSGPAPFLCAAALFVVAFLSFRDRGVYATIMWDEWEYDRYARLLPPAAADVPYYLYYAFYGLTKFCGDGFLGCVHSLNAVFFAASMPFIYLVCRRTAAQPVSLAVAVASVLGGISVYATHFMPEPMYFFGVWVGIWALLKSIDKDSSPVLTGIGAGAGLALLSLVKLHAIFLIPGVLLYFLVCALSGLSAGGVRKFAVLTFLTLISFFVVRFSLGYLIAGMQGMNIFGVAYGGKAQAAVSTGAVADWGARAWPFFAGHVLAILSMYAVPVLLTGSVRLKPVGGEARKILSLQILIGSLLLPLLVVVAFYTAHVSQLDPEIEGANGLLRLHLRYYNFLLPLFVILTAARAANAGDEKKFDPNKLLVTCIVAALIVFFVSDLSAYQLSVADGPELRGFATLRVVAYGLAGLAAMSAFLWAWSVKKAARLYIFLFFPLLTLMGAGAAFYSAHKEKTPNAYHAAGLFAKKYLKGDVAKMAVVGADYAGVYQAMFYADNPDIAYVNKIPEHSCLSFVPSPEGKEWIMLVGDYKIISATDQNIKGDGFVLMHTVPSTVESILCVD